MSGDPPAAGRLGPAQVDELLADVDAIDHEVRTAWPGRTGARQPVQVLYVSADQFDDTSTARAGASAHALLAAHAPDGASLADAIGVLSPDTALWAAVHRQVSAKLSTEPVEDVRVDFEDGFVGHSPAEERAHAGRTGAALGSMVVEGTAPPFAGLRVKSFTDGLARRSVDTLDRFLAALLDAAGRLPDNFAVTFPKIVAPAHVEAFVAVLAALEDVHGLRPGALRFEAQIETTASVLGPDGTVALRAIRDAGAGRLRGVHFGVFDYTAAIGLPPEQQRLDHPGCDLARHLIQVSLAGTEVQLSDGSSNVRPADDSQAEVHRVWQTHAAHVRHSLAHGFTQGWDLHPSHLVSRYATVYAHLLDGIDGVLGRLDRWDAGAIHGGVMDEPATVMTLRRRVDAARACGALPDLGG